MKTASIATAAILLLPHFAPAEEQQPPRGRPNIVFLFADDMGVGDVSCYGGKDVRTPQLDRLAGEGVRFTCFYAAGPECTPSRTALLTGRYPQRPGGLECAIGVGNVGRYDDAIALAARNDLGLPAEDAVLAPALKQAGYTNALIGKWHLGYEPKFHPLGQGFDRFFGFLGGNTDYFTHREQSDLHVLFDDREPVQRDGYMTHLITDEAIRFLRAHRDRPYFLFVSFSTPHFPFQGPHDRDVPLGENWSAGTREKYVEMVEDMDAQIGRILAVLDETGVADRTLVAFASDHGAPPPGSNAPFAGFKGSLFEGGLRSPLIVRWPGKIAAGMVSHQPCITMDLTEAFLSADGGRSPEGRVLDAIDILEHVAERRPEGPRTFSWRYRRGERTWRATRDGDLKYIHRRDGAEGETEWLFDLSKDPGEERNLLKQRGEDAERLRTALRAWEHEVRSPRLAALKQPE